MKPTKRPTTATTRQKRLTWRQCEQNDHNRPNAGQVGQDTRRTARGGPRGERRWDVQGMPAFLFYFINDYLTHSTPLPSPPFQNTKNMKNAPILGVVFVSRTTLTYPTSHIMLNTSCRTPKTRPYGCVLRVHLLFSPKTWEMRPPGRVSRSQCPPPSLNINNTLFWCVFGDRCLSSPTPHPQPPKTSTTAHFQEVDLSLPTTTNHNPQKRAVALVFGGIIFLSSSPLPFLLPLSTLLHFRYLISFIVLF